MTKDEQKLPGQAEIERCSRQREQHVQRHRVREELDVLGEFREGQNNGSSENSEQRWKVNLQSGVGHAGLWGFIPGALGSSDHICIFTEHSRDW